MTTLKDYLNDFAEDILKVTDDIRTNHSSESDNQMEWENAKEDKIVEYLKIIIERLIGE